MWMMTFKAAIEANRIHGIYGQEIDEPFARLLGQAVGTRLAGGRLVVGGDVRTSTPALKESLIAGVLSTGCQVYDVGILPTPVLHFAKDRLWADGVVAVTASHRPATENGFQISLGKLPTTDTEMHELWQIVQSRGPFASGAGTLYQHDILEPYGSFLVARFIPATPLRVVVDAHNGCMSQVADAALGFVGYDVVEQNCVPDGHFGDLVPDPFLPENMSSLSRSVLTHQAQLGVAYDGDGDSVVFADEQGTVLTPEQTLILFAHALLVYQPGREVIYDAAYAPYVAEEIRRVGGKPLPLQSSSEDIKCTFLEQGAALGGDLHGHYFFRTIGGDDALFATLVMLRFAGRHDGSLQPLISSMVAS
jgi:phosphomannomutase/phosphoglucomutase